MLDYLDVPWKTTEVWTVAVILLELVSPVWCNLMDTVQVHPQTGMLLPKSLQGVCKKWVSAACHSCRVQGALDSVQPSQCTTDNL